MGVKNLWDILESCKKTLPFHHLQNKRVCVDLSCWMVQFQNVNKSHCALKDKLYLKSLFYRLRALIALNCSLIFVTDGSIPAIKLSTYRRRLNAGDDVILDAKNSRGVQSLKRNMGSDFSCMIKEAKILGGALGIPCLDGIEEAEAQCALLDSESLCDGCFTSDSDAFLFGARTVYRDICLEGGYVVCYEMDDIERKLGFGRNSLICLAILLGSDYTQGIHGVGPESACQIVKSIGDSSVLQRFASEGMSIAKKQKTSKKKGQSSKENYDDNNNNNKNLNGIKCDLPLLDNQFVEVINAYMKPKCHSADSDTVHMVLALNPVNCSQLHQICAQFFDWSPEKTDEYILPKIAERKLRQFANLRSTSSELGVRLPIHEMPIKCPVSSILKQRKVQGRDYFQVSWEDFLISSSVPADLVESACPEKIVEFHERKAQKKKGRRKKKTDMNEIDQKLKELLLDIEKQSSGVSSQPLDLTTHSGTIANASCTSSSSYGTTGSASCTSSSYGTIANASCTTSSSGTTGKAGCTSSKPTETEIIDLLSPLPPPRAHQVSRRVDVIELSDSDNEASPQHAIKARDLRLFISNILD